MVKHAPGLAKIPAEQKTTLDTHLTGLEVLEMYEPLKTGEPGTWRVPCRIKWKAQGASGKEIRVRYDETLGRFIVSGGI
jgi:hypothetical protein